MNACRVGQNYFRTLARYFYIAIQMAGIAAVDLIQDHTCRTRCQPGVGAHPASLLCLHVGTAVVEHCPLSVHIKLAVGIAGNARRRGGLNVDHGHAIGCWQHCGALIARGFGVSNDLGMHWHAHRTDAQGRNAPGNC